MLFNFTVQSATVTTLAFGIIASTPINLSATEPKIKTQNDSHEQVSTSATDLGGTIKLSCDTSILLIQSKDCPTGGENFKLNIPQEIYTLEQKPDEQYPDWYFRIYKFEF
ncbi:MAG: hypothetical protein HC836_27685 [Richelia sp. RM2_1_2]|nr:hypothetical protein [Richelia sp. RM2_1_2]